MPTVFSTTRLRIPSFSAFCFLISVCLLNCLESLRNLSVLDPEVERRCLRLCLCFMTMLHNFYRSACRRVSIVDYLGAIKLDCWVKPTLPVSDYRTVTTGIEPHHLNSEIAVSFDDVQRHIASLIANKILVGHCLWNDLSVLGLPHPAVATRDVALYQPFRNALRSPNQVIGLQTLMWHLMVRQVQTDKIDPLENARATVDLYRSASAECEVEIASGKWPFALPPANFARCYL